MLGKLLKHEFRYYVKRYLPFMGIVLGTALIMRIIMIAAGASADEIFIGNTESDAASVFLSLLSTILNVGSYVLCIYAFFGAISRFHTNIYTDEGYLMNTLPVRPSELIISKFIGAVVCYAVSMAVIAGSMWIVYNDSEYYSSLISIFTLFISEFEKSEIVIYIVNFFVMYCAFILLCYMCESIRNKMGSRRGVAVFLGFAFIFINTIVFAFIEGFAKAASNDELSYTGVLMISIIYYIIVSVLMFLITRSIIKNHLNLE